MSKDQKYLDKLLGKNHPAVAIEHVLERVQDDRLENLALAISELQIGVAASIDEDGDVYIGKGLDDGTNHYIIIHANSGGWSYAYANQSKNDGKILECKTLFDAIRRFREATKLN
jgi:hypothetical protein